MEELRLACGMLFSILQLVEMSNKHIQWEWGRKGVSLCALLELVVPSCIFVASSKRRVD